jgi:glucose/arabinose dehydrogenase
VGAVLDGKVAPTLRRTLGLAALLTLALAARAAAAPTLVPVGGTFDNPIYVASPPRDTSRLFVVQRGGVIRVVRNGTLLAKPFLDLSSQVATDGERGLLSIAFPPDYAHTGAFYVYLAARPRGQLQIREYHRTAASPSVADPRSMRIVWRAAHYQDDHHNGGTIAFGPDGMLWLAIGDGGGANDQFGHAQDTSSPLGKLIRINPRRSGSRPFSVPADNPYGNSVWARGLRNPFRFSFDRKTGDLVIGDVGQGEREEVDWVTRASGLGRGANFGWACEEGTVTGPNPDDCPLGPDYIAPVFDYSRPSPRAITGGVVVRDPGLPTLVGRYVYADSYAGDVRSLALATPRATGDASAGLPQRDQIVDLGEDACGHVYVVSLTGGTVERIQDGAPGACVLSPF